MWIVRVALQRPYTFVVLAVLILLASPVLILRTPTDIFPSIDIPVIAVAWQFTGLNPEEMEGRITTQFERVLTTTVDNIEHIESTTVNGQSMVKIFLQPNARLDTANAQVTAISQTILRQLPPGIQPPLINNYSASTVPILRPAVWVMIRGGWIPGGSWRRMVCDIAVTCAFAVSRRAFGCRKILTIDWPLTVVDSMCSMLSTVVVRTRSNWVVILPSISSGFRPVNCQATAITGMSMLGKMSVGVRRIRTGL